jgi:hypothetical protein
MNEDVLKGSVISRYKRNGMKNYKALANLFVINSKNWYQYVFYILFPFMKRLTGYYTSYLWQLYVPGQL